MKSPVKVVMAFLLVVIAIDHLNLYLREQYHFIPVIGPLFLVATVSGIALAIMVLVRPSALVYLAAGLFALGVLLGYLLALGLPHGIFGFRELIISYSGFISILAELGVAGLAGYSLLPRRRAGLSRTPH